MLLSEAIFLSNLEYLFKNTKEEGIHKLNSKTLQSCPSILIMSYLVQAPLVTDAKSLMWGGYISSTFDEMKRQVIPKS